MTSGIAHEARSSFDAGDFRGARDAALRGLADKPDDPDLLRWAGKAGVELATDDAVSYLERLVKVQPDDAQGWSDLGDALAAEGRTGEATEAFRQAVELNPDDETSLAQLGHTAAAMGEQESAIDYLQQAAERGRGDSTAVISLVEMYRSAGQTEEALAAAVRITEAQPDDLVAALDVADLSLALGRLDEALAAFERLREIDDLADHEVYALHGMIDVELRREDWARALELAGEASGIDPHGRSNELLSFVEGQAAGAPDESAPSRADVDGALAASHIEHRRLHAEDRRLQAEDLA